MRTLNTALPSIPHATPADASIDDEDLQAFLENEYGEGLTAVWQRTSDNAVHVSLLPPQDAMERAVAVSAAQAQARAEQDDAGGLAAMPRGCALFKAAVHQAKTHGWIDTDALASFEWDALVCLAALALCMALYGADEEMAEVFCDTAALQPLRAGCRAFTGAATDLYRAVSQNNPQHPLAQSIRDEAQALCLRDRHRTTLLLQHACKEPA